jgi:hypothetical protein
MLMNSVIPSLRGICSSAALAMTTADSSLRSERQPLGTPVTESSRNHSTSLGDSEPEHAGLISPSRAEAQVRAESAAVDATREIDAAQVVQQRHAEARA